MKRKIRRYRLKSSESRDLAKKLLQIRPELSPLLPKGKKVLEVVEFETGKGIQKIFLHESVPILVELYNKEILPYIEAAERANLDLPRVVVDLGAVPHIANGADVMGPGIVRVDGEVKEDDLVLVTDEKFGRIIAIGRALRDKTRIKSRGKSIENLHYAGDIFWKVAKEPKGKRAR